MESGVFLGGGDDSLLFLLLLPILPPGLVTCLFGDSTQDKSHKKQVQV